MTYNLSNEDVALLIEALSCLEKKLNIMRVNGDEAIDYSEITTMLHRANLLLDKFKEK